MKTQTYIFVHDQNIILDYKKNEKFKNLENLKYIFLGKRDVDLIENFNDVIICRNLKYNIEDYPNLTSFSGWYAIWKNKLYDKGYLNLFEYDINLSENFLEVYENSLKLEPNIIGYLPFSPFDNLFVKVKNLSQELLNSIKEIYNQDFEVFLENLPETITCSITSNHTFYSEMFEKYMEWMELMIDNIKQSYYSGHQMERSISIFYLLNNIEKVILLPNILFHFQLDSHGTQGFGQNKFISNYNNLFL
jgi:hypothetical protein